MVRQSTVVFLVKVILLCLLSSRSFADRYPEDFFTPPQLQYPVVNNSMVAAVGEVDIKLEYPVLQSIAIVGADEISAHWLRLNNDYLVSIDAIGVVIQVESEEQLKTLQLYTDIPLISAPGFGAPEFGEVYPIVVDKTAGRIRQ